MSSIGNSGSANTREKEPEKREVLLKKRAKKDLRGILAYLEGERPSSAEAFLARLSGLGSLLADMPLLGRAARSTRMLRKGYRCFVLEDYLVYYKSHRSDIAIYRIRHASQRPPDSILE